MAARDWDRATRVGAAELQRLSDPRIGADRWNPGKYAIYFYDEDWNEIRSSGGFDSPAQAAEAVPFLQAESILEAVALDEVDC